MKRSSDVMAAAFKQMRGFDPRFGNVSSPRELAEKAGVENLHGVMLLSAQLAIADIADGLEDGSLSLKDVVQLSRTEADRQNQIASMLCDSYAAADPEKAEEIDAEVETMRKFEAAIQADKVAGEINDSVISEDDISEIVNAIFMPLTNPNTRH